MGKAIRCAKIIVTLDKFNLNYTKYFTGTEEKIYAEAIDWTYAIALRFIEDNNITDVKKQYAIMEDITHYIEWEEEPIYMYIVTDKIENMSTVYPNLADAEEAVLEECQSYAYKIMMIADPMEIFGRNTWNWKDDFKYLTSDCGRDFIIQTIPVFGVKEIKK